ncbi:MAG TPA: response regulator [Candidatus Sulfotelmatobacter sp.]|nr:response regulator [Candidatus Sulfotelmatobacter sp.]
MPQADNSFLAGGGKMGELTRAKDWAGTALGPVAGWPQSLKTAVSICLGSRHPIVVWWGHPNYIQFYNDAYISFLGENKHPTFLGCSGRDCWREIWPTIGPMLESVYASGQATWSEDLLLVLHRNLPQEEGYFTFSYSPIRDDKGGIGGIFCACNETTERVIGERRLRTLRDLSRIEAETRAADTACAVAARTLGENPADIPFALIYLLDEDGVARRVATSGLAATSPAAPSNIDLNHTDNMATWPLRQVLQTGLAQLVTGLPTRFEPLPGGPWPESPEAALAVPIAAPGQAGPTGFLIAGLSPRRLFDADYRAFLDLAAGHIGTSIANARAYEVERQRADLLAELDRAKTAFFSNVSHEFRTPLTLMMGPLEDALAQSPGLAAADRERLELAHRNALRLLKLVNSLLDFSRIEAGRIQASYEAIDLAALTAELASLFRSAIERAGMKLVILCPPLAEPVYVDREMWEKIVLNLISNAFKFTFVGEIEVTLQQNGAAVELAVRDTGTGIPAEEIPRLFERFHRVVGARGRSHEGSGIGLALVQELARLHGGSVGVESELERGSRFTVSIPLGRDHLPADRIEAARILASTGSPAEAYVEEVLRWSANAGAETTFSAAIADHGFEDFRAGSLVDLAPAATQGTRRILLADDNADMRTYLSRLLIQRGYDVETVADGLAALRATRLHKPDLVLADVMMPELDGFGLLAEVRAEESLRELPVILLSARAGEEARIEGMHAGADDYLTKPFSARELLARVEAHLNMARLRQEATAALRRRTAQFETLLNQAPLGVYLLDADFRVRQVNPIAGAMFGDVPGGVVGRDFAEIAHVLWEQSFAEELIGIFRHTLATGRPYLMPEQSEKRADSGKIEYYEWRLDRILLPDGRYGVVCYFRDIAEQVKAETTRRLLLDELNHRVKNTLASVQAVMQQTLRSSRNPADFAERFSGRVQSLARAHSLLTEATWQGADLRELVRDQLLQGPVDETRVAALGPAVRLDPQMTLHLALMLHELGTNSVKYGALSTGQGWVTIGWSVRGERLQLKWVERGGPPVAAPGARGFGTILIEHSTTSAGGSARAAFDAEGITWEIVLPLPRANASTAASERTDPEPTGTAMHLAEDGTARPHLSGQRWLVVEDEPLVAMTITDILEGTGVAVAGSVGTEKEAIAVIEKGALDGVLLDANLRGRSADQIATLLQGRGIPFLFVTGYGASGVPAAFKHIGVVAKPFTEEQLLAAIGKLSGKGR